MAIALDNKENRKPSQNKTGGLSGPANQTTTIRMILPSFKGVISIPIMDGGRF